MQVEVDCSGERVRAPGVQFLRFPCAGHPILACEIAFPPGALFRVSERNNGLAGGTDRGFGWRVCNAFAGIGEAGVLHTRQPNPPGCTFRFDINDPPGIKSVKV